MEATLKQVSLTLERFDHIQTELLPYRGHRSEAVYRRTGHRVLYVYVFTPEPHIEVAPARLQRFPYHSVGLLARGGRAIGAEDADDDIVGTGLESCESVRF
jgi:hypothetical protein